MEFLSSQLRQISEQLRGMAVSQRIAIGLLVVVLVAGMWGLIRWGSEPNWTPLLDQAFTPTEVQRVQSELRVAGVSSRVQGDRILIRGDDEERQRVQAMLSERGALPADTSLGYASLVNQNSVFIGEQRSRWLESRGLEAELSAVLRKFQGIRDARVLVTVPQKRGFSRQESTSSASVALTLAEGNELDKNRVLAIANFVAGAVPGLKPANIKITDGKRFYRPPDGMDHVSTELLEQQQRIEDHYMQKIYDQLRHIPGVVVNVHAKLRTASEKSQQEIYGPPAVQRETITTEETGGASRAAEPAVRPNTRVGLTDAAAGSSSTREESDTTFSDKRDVKMTVIDELRGSVDRLSASVSIPRSFLERIVEGMEQSKDQPREAATEKVASVELPRIKALVRPLIDAQADDQVVVDWYYDLPATSAPGAEASGEEAGFFALAKSYGPRAALGLLALMAIVFTARIARKAHAGLPSPRGVAAAGAGGAMIGGAFLREDSPLQTLSSGTSPVGEAEEIPGVLVAQEVDEATVRTQQIIKQIGQLVKEDASTAANIVSQWISESE